MRAHSRRAARPGWWASIGTLRRWSQARETLSEWLRPRRARSRRLPAAAAHPRRARPRWPSTAPWPTSACRRCSSTAQGAASVSSATSRSTCGWTRAPGPTAADLIAAATEEDLANVIYQFGEERRSRAVARAIAHVRRQTPIRTTGQLAALVRRVVGRRIAPDRSGDAHVPGAADLGEPRARRARRHSCTTTCARLRAGARFVILTFHSLEDRPVKHALRDLARAEGSSFRLLTKKPVVPGSEEIRLNPRARSAKLRAIERLM